MRGWGAAPAIILFGPPEGDLPAQKTISKLCNILLRNTTGREQHGGQPGALRIGWEPLIQGHLAGRTGAS